MNASHFSNDCLEFITLLNKHSVRFVIVGGEAVIYHGYIRLTGDVDFFFDRATENCNLLFKTLNEFWEGSIPGGITIHDLKARGYFIQFGVPPNRIDLMNQIDGVTFEEVWENRINEVIDYKQQKISVFFIGINELIKNKSRSDRPKDQEDLIYLKSNLE